MRPAAAKEGWSTEEVRIEPGLALRFVRPAGEIPRAVLYFHGLGSTQDGEKAEFFRKRCVAAGTPFCSIDFRGHGASQGTNLDLCLTRHLDDARAAVAHLRQAGVSEVDLVGSSLGGLTALWLGRLDPGTVRRTAVIAPALGIRGKIVDALGEELLERWRSDGEIPYVNELGTTVIGYGFFEDLARYPDDELASGYGVPTLVLQGGRDDSVDPAAVRAFAASCRDVTLHVWPDGDHRLTDRLDEVWQRTAGFLAA